MKNIKLVILLLLSLLSFKTQAQSWQEELPVGRATDIPDFTFKRPVRAVSTTNITLSGTQTIDGVVLTANQRVLVTGQTTASQNGIYVVRSGAWLRPFDANNKGDMKSGTIVAVEEGTTNGNTIWMLTTDNPVVVGTTSLTFTKTYPSGGGSGVATITAGSGISISGTTDVTVSATDPSTTNETLANNDQTLAAARNVNLNTYSFNIIGSAYQSIWTAAGNFGVSNDAFTPFNRLHLKTSQTSGANAPKAKGLTITGSLATDFPGIIFEGPDAPSNARVFGLHLYSGSGGNAAMRLSLFGDNAGTEVTSSIMDFTHLGNVGFGIAPVVKHHIHVPAATTAVFSKWSNGTTLGTSTDGLDIGLSSSNPAVAEFRYRENANMIFYTNNTQRMIIEDDGSVYIGSGTSSTIQGSLTNHRGSPLTSGMSSGYTSSTTGVIWRTFSGTSSYVGVLEGTTTSAGGLLVSGTSSLVRGLDVVAGGSPLLCVKNVSGAKVGIGKEDATEALDITGNLQLNTIGNKILIKEGTNASMGIATLGGGTVTVNNTLVTANSRIFVTTQTPGGTVGYAYISARTAGTSFTITSTSALDTSIVAWWIFEPAP